MSYWINLRTLRNQKLHESDWAVLSDSPLTEEQKADVVTYRQALRDLPENTDNPEWPIWPSKPACLGSE